MRAKALLFFSAGWALAAVSAHYGTLWASAVGVLSGFFICLAVDLVQQWVRDWKYAASETSAWRRLAEIEKRVEELESTNSGGGSR